MDEHPRTDEELRELYGHAAGMIVGHSVMATIGILGWRQVGEVEVSGDAFFQAASAIMTGTVHAYLTAHSLHLPEDQVERGTRFLFQEIYREIRDPRQEILNLVEGMSWEELRGTLLRAAQRVASSHTDVLYGGGESNGEAE